MTASIEIRALPGSDVRLSALTFGSMRMSERGLDEAYWEELLAHSVDKGVTTFHSSNEYETFPLFCRVVDRLRKNGRSSRIQHIVKLAAPHFGEPGFDPHVMRKRVEAYLSELKADRLDVVQWMWRGDLKQEDERLRLFDAQSFLIGEVFAELRTEGKVGSFAPFPYTDGFAHRALDQPWCSGLAVYLNPVEIDSIELAGRAAATERGIIALRPLAAKRALAAGHTARGALRWTLAQPAVVSGVLSYSSSQQLADLVGT